MVRILFRTTRSSGGWDWVGPTTPPASSSTTLATRYVAWSHTSPPSACSAPTPLGPLIALFQAGCVLHSLPPSSTAASSFALETSSARLIAPGVRTAQGLWLRNDLPALKCFPSVLRLVHT
ncbi:hypothetical protein FS749_009111 [Ceratobasidium sp. UAMH 11750]|nr:hypothetical protein FS749_009111 [Ceratobasidium sp. UAMH 11750]